MLKGKFISSSHQCVPVIVAPAFSWDGETGSRGENREQETSVRGYRYKKQCCGKMCTEKTACSPSFFPASPIKAPPFRFPVQQELMWLQARYASAHLAFPGLQKPACESWLALCLAPVCQPQTTPISCELRTTFSPRPPPTGPVRPSPVQSGPVRGLGMMGGESSTKSTYKFSTTATSWPWAKNLQILHLDVYERDLPIYLKAHTTSGSAH